MCGGGWIGKHRKELLTAAAIGGAAFGGPALLEAITAAGGTAAAGGAGGAAAGGILGSSAIPAATALEASVVPGAEAAWLGASTVPTTLAPEYLAASGIDFAGYGAGGTGALQAGGPGGDLGQGFFAKYGPTISKVGKVGLLTNNLGTNNQPPPLNAAPIPVGGGMQVPPAAPSLAETYAPVLSAEERRRRQRNNLMRVG